MRCFVLLGQVGAYCVRIGGGEDVAASADVVDVVCAGCAGGFVWEELVVRRYEGE